MKTMLHNEHKESTTIILSNMPIQLDVPVGKFQDLKCIHDVIVLKLHL